MPMRSEAAECTDPEDLAQRQIERLQSTLNRANKNVPFYRNLFRAAGVDPSRVESPADLGRIPFTGREALGENYPYGLFAVPLRDVVRIHTAPGSEGRPTVSGYTRQDLVVWRELIARALTAAGVSGTDILHVDLEPGLANWGRDYKDGAEAVEAGVIPLTVLPPEKRLMVLCDYRTSVLVTSPPAAAQLLHHLFRAGMNPNALSLRTLILVGESPDEELRARIEERLHVKTWVHYGLSDVPGPALAFECRERSGLHVSEDHFFPEVVDPETGSPVAEGEAGELVLTTLTTRAFPLIRFRTGDRVRMVPGPCACGRTLRRIQWLPGRTDGAVTVRGVRLHHRQIRSVLEHALGEPPGLCRFAVVRREMTDLLEVRLEVHEGVFSDEIKEMERLSLRLASELSLELGTPVRIRFQEKSSFDVSTPEGIEDCRE